MANWLYDSRGKPIAFVSGGNVFSRSGRFLGRLEGNEVWHGTYIGEIVHEDRLLRRTGKARVRRGTPGTPGTPGIPGSPGSRGAIGLPAGYRDIELES